MTSTLGASRHAAATAPTSRAAARRWLAGGIAAGPVFLVAGVVQASPVTASTSAGTR